MKPYVLSALSLVAALSVVAAVGEARNPDKDEMDRVSDLAYQLAIDTDEAYVESVQMVKSGDAKEESALERLHSLMVSASSFYEQVEATHETPEPTTAAFKRLNNDFIGAHEGFSQLGAHEKHRELFDTIEDAMGSLRYYYVDKKDYKTYPDHKVYPYYPGSTLFVHVWTPGKPYHFRHATRWHLHPTHHKLFPHRVEYRPGYGRHKVHFSSTTKYSWHRKTVKTKVVAKPRHKAQVKTKTKAKTKAKAKRKRNGRP